jgi:hypothetical protein
VSERRFRRGLLRVLAGGVVLWARLATVLFGGPAGQDRRAARTEEAIKALQQLKTKLQGQPKAIQSIETLERSLKRELTAEEEQQSAQQTARLAKDREAWEAARARAAEAAASPAASEGQDPRCT